MFLAFSLGVGTLGQQVEVGRRRRLRHVVGRAVAGSAPSHAADEKRASQGFEQRESEPDVVDVFRGMMRQVYMPIFETLRGKYASKGISMELDADEFLGGGPSLRIKFSYGDLTMDLDGTVMRGGVAFYIVRGVGSKKGALVSGPMLRIRNLTAENFREFIVGHLSQLIKDAIRQA